MPGGYPVHPGTVTVASTQAERIEARAAVYLDSVRHMELRAHDGDPSFDDAIWVRGHLVYWWKPEIEALKRAGRLGEALELAWECMEAVEHERPTPYGWAWEVAVIARKLRRFDLEVEVIDRYMSLRGPNPQSDGRWERRREKALRLAEVR